MSNDRNGEMILKRHQKYRLLRSERNYSLVQNLDTDEKQLCFAFDDHKVGDVFYLFHNKKDNYDVTKSVFDYSVLNLYEEGRTYTFEVRKSDHAIALVSNSKYFEFVVPSDFVRSGSTRIDLEVEKLVLNENKVFFKRPQDGPPPFTPIEDFDFEEDKVYMIKVVRQYFNRNGTRFAILEHEGRRLRTNLPTSLNETELDEEMPFVLGFFENGNPTLNITKEYAISKLYELGNKYEFTLMEHLVDEELGVSSWCIVDQYGLYHYYYPESDPTYNPEYDTLEVKDRVELYVRYFSKNGSLRLVCDITEIEDKKYRVEDLFSYTGYHGREEELFFSEEMLNTDTDVAVKPRHSYLDQYQDGENLWVFTYLSHIDYKIFESLENKNFELAKTLIDKYIKIERWILEGSDYLTNFYSANVGVIIQKAEFKIERYSYTLRAIDMILNNQDITFLNKIQERLQTSPYLSRDNKGVLKELLRLSQYFIGSIDDKEIYYSILLFFKNGFFEDADFVPYIVAVESKIKRIRNKMPNYDSNLLINDDKETLELLILNQHLLNILNQLNDKTERAVITSAMLLRFLSAYYEEERYLDLSIAYVTSQSYISEELFGFKNIMSLSFEDLTRGVSKVRLTPTYYIPSGLIENVAGKMSYIPFNLYKGKYSNLTFNIAELPNMGLIIKSDFNLGALSMSMSPSEMAQKAISLIKFKRSRAQIEAKNIDFDKLYKGKITLYGDKDTYCFLTLPINNREVTLLLHTLSINRTKFRNPISSYTNLGDYINFRFVREKDDGNFEVECDNISKEALEKLLERPRNTYAIVMERYKNTNFALTETGLPIVFYKVRSSVGDVFEVEVDGYNSAEGNFTVSSVTPTDYEFFMDINMLWRQYLIDTDVLIEDDFTSSKPIHEMEYLYENKGILNSLTLQIVYALEQKLHFLTDEREIIMYYYFMVSLSGIIRHSKSYYFMEKLEGLARIIEFRENKDFSSIINMPESMRKGFVESKDGMKALEILQYINHKDIDVKVEVEVGTGLFRLKKLVETYNLFKDIDEEHKMLDYFIELITNQFYVVILEAEGTRAAVELESILYNDNEDDNDEYTKKGGLSPSLHQKDSD